MVLIFQIRDDGIMVSNESRTSSPVAFGRSSVVNEQGRAPVLAQHRQVMGRALVDVSSERSPSSSDQMSSWLHHSHVVVSRARCLYPVAWLVVQGRPARLRARVGGLQPSSTLCS